MLTPLLLALAMTGQAPQPKAPDLKTQRAIDLAKQVEKKKAAAQLKVRRRVTKAQAEYQARRELAAYEERMAPIWAKQQADQARLLLEQQRANAMSAIAGAAQREADTDARRLRIQAREAGYPQFGLQQIVPGP